MLDVRRYLIVTDHALNYQQLTRKVQHALAAGPCQFYLLVLPTTPGNRDSLWWVVAAGQDADPQHVVAYNPGPAKEQGWDNAHRQLGQDLDRLHKLGADADGEVGEPHPMRAIREVLAKQPADEIILATAPHRVAKLLAMDLTHRVHRSTGLPVSVLGEA
jgi:hypothetical protein